MTILNERVWAFATMALVSGIAAGGAGACGGGEAAPPREAAIGAGGTGAGGAGAGGFGSSGAPDAGLDAADAGKDGPSMDAPGPDAGLVVVEEKTIAELQAELSATQITSVQLVDAYLDRIQKLDQGPSGLHAVLALNPHARDDAAALDVERSSKGPRGPLHGIPILIKDNIETIDPVPTTAGSLALEDNLTMRDAPLVARLRAAGAIVLGKTNLSEWANIRSTNPLSGWSAVGGLTHNPYALDRSACGSSAGSGAGTAASLGAAAVGTETNGSIVCPSTMNGVVGLKPTVGLISRTHVVPISHTQDTAGPIGRTVADVATLLTAMAGSDPADPATSGADGHKQDYTSVLKPDALNGKRLGALSFLTGYDAKVDAAFVAARASLIAAGAEIVDIAAAPSFAAINANELKVLLVELKVDLNLYLASTPPSVATRTLADVIAFDDQNASTEMQYFQQELFLMAQATSGLSDPAYVSGVSAMQAAAGANGIDALISKNGVDALIAPTGDRAWVVDMAKGDPKTFHVDAALPAVAGYPHLTVPMAQIDGMPVGLSFIGGAWSEAALLAFGYAFEQQTKARKPPTYAASLGP